MSLKVQRLPAAVLSSRFYPFYTHIGVTEWFNQRETASLKRSFLVLQMQISKCLTTQIDEISEFQKLVFNWWRPNQNGKTLIKFMQANCTKRIWSQQRMFTKTAKREFSVAETVLQHKVQCTLTYYRLFVLLFDSRCLYRCKMNLLM